jgi:orotidine 5'-phosphate decarboxylase subfamily 2
MTFAERIDASVEDSGSLLCLGLDPDGMDSAQAAERFCRDALDAALDQVCAVKANLAFFEQFGSAGYAVLERLRAQVPRDRIFILDGKRGDIASTSAAYARALFDVLGADAVTVNPLMGTDSILPFLKYDGRGSFLVARSSNASAADLLEAPMVNGHRLYERIVELGLRADPGGAVGFVVGATDATAVGVIRGAAPRAPLLVPGVGAQGGALEAGVRAGMDTFGGRVLISVSRGITGAAEGPAAAAAKFRRRIEEVRKAAVKA